MKKALLLAVGLCCTLFASGAHAGNGTPVNPDSANAITLAVFGDWPYSLALVDAAPLLIDSINSDPKVRLVCTSSTSTFKDEAARAQEVAERTGADIRWLERAFATAEANGAEAVLIGLHADMWDPAALILGGDGLSGYTRFVRKLADLSLHFGRPVLLINGDSHLFGTDQPLADPSSPTGVIHGTQPVTNLTRITVQGSTNKPREWLRLTIDPRSPRIFSWQNVVYCDDTTCPN